MDVVSSSAEAARKGAASLMDTLPFVGDRDTRRRRRGGRVMIHKRYNILALSAKDQTSDASIEDDVLDRAEFIDYAAAAYCLGYAGLFVTAAVLFWSPSANDTIRQGGYGMLRWIVRNEQEWADIWNIGLVTTVTATLAQFVYTLCKWYHSVYWPLPRLGRDDPQYVSAFSTAARLYHKSDPFHAIVTAATDAMIFVGCANWAGIQDLFANVYGMAFCVVAALTLAGANHWYQTTSRIYPAVMMLCTFVLQGTLMITLYFALLKHKHPVQQEDIPTRVLVCLIVGLMWARDSFRLSYIARRMNKKTGTRANRDVAHQLRFGRLEAVTMGFNFIIVTMYTICVFTVRFNTSEQLHEIYGLSTN
jgi:hypothetical protein